MIKSLFLFLVSFNVFAYTLADTDKYNIVDIYTGYNSQSYSKDFLICNANPYCYRNFPTGKPYIEFIFNDNSNIELSFETNDPSWKISIIIDGAIEHTDISSLNKSSFVNVKKIKFQAPSVHLFLKYVSINFVTTPTTSGGGDGGDGTGTGGVGGGYDGSNTDFGDVNYFKSNSLGESKIIDDMLVFTSFEQMKDKVPAVASSYGSLFGFASLMLATCDDYSSSNYKLCELYYKPKPLATRTSCDTNDEPYHFKFIADSVDGGHFCALKVLLPVSDLQFLTNNIVKVNDLLLNSNILTGLTFAKLDNSINDFSNEILTKLDNLNVNTDFSGVNAGISSITASVDNLTLLNKTNHSATAEALADLSLQIEDIANATNTALATDIRAIRQVQTYFNEEQIIIGQNVSKTTTDVENIAKAQDIYAVNNHVKLDSISAQISNLSTSSGGDDDGSWFDFFSNDDSDGSIAGGVDSNFSQLGNNLVGTSIDIKGGDCPVFHFQLEYFRSEPYVLNSHCSVLSSVAPILQPLLLLVFGIIGFRTVFTA